MWYFFVLLLGVLDMISTELALAKGAFEANPFYPMDPAQLAPYLMLKFIILLVFCFIFMFYFKKSFKHVQRTKSLDGFMYVVGLSVICAYVYAVTNNFLIVFD